MKYFYTTVGCRKTLIAKIYKNLGCQVSAKFSFTNVLQSSVLCAIFFEIIIILVILVIIFFGL